MAESGATETEINTATFFRVMGLLIECGYPILYVFEMLLKCSYIDPAAVEAIHQEVLEGQTISGAMAKFGSVFTPSDCAAISVGEQTGAFPEVCWFLGEARELSYTLPRSVDHGALTDLMDTVYLSVLVDAGLPFRRAFRVMAKIAASQRREMYQAIADDLDKGGLTLSEALEKQGVFEPFVITMVKNGESKGSLKKTFAHIVTYRRWRVLGMEHYIPLEERILAR